MACLPWGRTKERGVSTAECCAKSPGIRQDTWSVRRIIQRTVSNVITGNSFPSEGNKLRRFIHVSEGPTGPKTEYRASDKQWGLEVQGREQQDSEPVRVYSPQIDTVTHGRSIFTHVTCQGICKFCRGHKKALLLTTTKI